jgi:hypothetical protein
LSKRHKHNKIIHWVPFIFHKDLENYNKKIISFI